MNSFKYQLKLEVHVDLHIKANFWRQLWATLPDDAEITRSGYHLSSFNDPDGDTISFTFISKEFDPVDWTQVNAPPFMVLHMKDSAIVDMKVNGVTPKWFNPPTQHKAPDFVAPSTSGVYTVRMSNGSSKNVTRAELEAMGVSIGGSACICDMAYTGLKTHRKDCPCQP